MDQREDTSSSQESMDRVRTSPVPASLSLSLSLSFSLLLSLLLSLSLSLRSSWKAASAVKAFSFLLVSILDVQKGEFNKEGLIESLDGLENKEIGSVKNWHNFFLTHAEYKHIGKLVGWYYDEKGQDTPNMKRVSTSPLLPPFLFSRPS